MTIRMDGWRFGRTWGHSTTNFVSFKRVCRTRPGRLCRRSSRIFVFLLTNFGL